MVAINPEMLKELLDEFTEKEQVTYEEMNAINQQIGELEKRIESSREKLASLTKDKERVDAMRDRYLTGTWRNFRGETLSALSILTGGAALPVAPAAPSVAAAPAPAKAHKASATNIPAAPAPEPPAPAPSLTRTNRAPTPRLAPEPAPPESPPEAAAPAPAPAEEVSVGSSFETMQPVAAPELEDEQEVAVEIVDNIVTEEAPPDDPILSSLSSTAGHVPDIEKALASGSEYDAVAQESLETDSGFSWTSTAIPSEPENPWGAPSPNPSSGSSPSPNPSASAPEPMPAVSPADAWGSPTPAAPAAAAPAAAVPATPAWGGSSDAWGTPPAPAAPSAPDVSAAPAPWGTPSSPWGTPSSVAPAPAASISAPAPAPAAEPAWGQGQGQAWGQSQTNMPVAPTPAPAPAPQVDSPWGSSAAPAPAAPSWGGGASAAPDSPWGTPAAAAPESAAPAPAPGPADESTNSGGATISSVKGRRKREAAPAYDWGEPQDQQAGADDDESGRKISDALKGFFK